METTSSDESSDCFPLPFVGREKETAQLSALHARRRNILIIGEKGAGKSALVRHVRSTLPFHLSTRSKALREIFGGLETGLGIHCDTSTLVERKRTLLKRIAVSPTPIVFDDVEWTTPKLSSFLESVSERTPIWICARSEHPWDIGHFWPLLVRFARVEVRPFHLHEVHALVSKAAGCEIVPPEALEIVEWLYRTSAGNPGRLCKLLKELANGHYDVRNPRSLRLLKLDWHIHDIFPDRLQEKATKGLP